MQKRLLVSSWRYNIVQDLLQHFTFGFCIDQWQRLRSTEDKTLYHAVFAAAHLSATQIDKRLLAALQHWAYDNVASNNFLASLLMQLMELNGDALCLHTDESCTCTHKEKMRQAYRSKHRDDFLFMTKTVPMPGYAHQKINMFEACILFAARGSAYEMNAVMHHLGM